MFTPLVRMSAGLCSDLILCIEISPCFTSCCTKRCFSSMCFAFFDVPSLIVMDFAALLSVCIFTFVLMSNASCTKLRMHRPSVHAVPMAYSSDSAQESATTACVRDAKCMHVPR